MLKLFQSQEKPMGFKSMGVLESTKSRASKNIGNSVIKEVEKPSISDFGDNNSNTKQNINSKIEFIEKNSNDNVNKENNNPKEEIQVSSIQDRIKLVQSHFKSQPEMPLYKREESKNASNEGKPEIAEVKKFRMIMPMNNQLKPFNRQEEEIKSKVIQEKIVNEEELLIDNFRPITEKKKKKNINFNEYS